MRKSHSGEGTADRVRQLFAKLTAALEDAHELTVEGQNPLASVGERKKLLQRLDRRFVRCHATIAEIGTLLGP